MEFTETKIIQLREKYGQGLGMGDNYINGSFSSNFEEEEIAEGDTLLMKSCYLDTAESSAGKIQIASDETNFSVSFYHYIKNWTIQDKEYNLNAPTTLSQPDGQDYYLCDSKNVSGGFTKKLESITMEQNMSGTGTAWWGNAGVVFEYRAPSAPNPPVPTHPISYFTLKMEKIRHDPTNKITYTESSVDKNGVNLGLGFLFNSNYPFEISKTKNNIGNLESNAHSINCVDIGTTSTNIDNGTIRTPHQFTFDFVIPEGGYDPAELSRIITDKCSLLRVDGSQLDDYPMRSPFLTTNRQYAIDFPQADDNTFYCAEGGQNFYRYTNPNVNDYLSGTSEFGLKYDEGQDKYQFETLNIPYYVMGQPSIEAVRKGSTDDFFLVNKNCGIAFTQLSPPNVWYKKMGFDPNICISATSVLRNFSGTIANQRIPIIIGAIEGISTTGTYKGLDTAVYKVGGTPTSGLPNPHGARAFTSTQLEGTPTSNLNQSIIYADLQVAQIQYSYAYYMIEIDLGIQQSLVSKAYNSTKIQSIIGRFYSKDSFTNAYNEGSIPYTHRGKSVKLSSARIRVLDDDGEPANDIGDNNSIFMELVKIVKPPSVVAETIPLDNFLQIKVGTK